MARESSGKLPTGRAGRIHVLWRTPSPGGWHRLLANRCPAVGVRTGWRATGATQLPECLNPLMHPSWRADLLVRPLPSAQHAEHRAFGRQCQTHDGRAYGGPAQGTLVGPSGAVGDDQGAAS